jgi:hypothetical protein
MPSITFTISYQKNTGLVYSASELKSLYLFGLPLTNVNGQSITDDMIDAYIRGAQDYVEDILNIKLNRQAIQEDRTFYIEDWWNWGYFPTTYPVVDAHKVLGFYNTTLQIDYPKEWLSVKKQIGDESGHRNINLVPLQGSVTTLSGQSIFVGLTPYVGYFGNKTIPNYWQLTYVTGFNRVPQNFLKAIALRAKIDLLPVISQNVGVPGVTNKSIGIDGLSQSVSTTASSSSVAFGALAKIDGDQFDKIMEALKANYVGVTIGSLALIFGLFLPML